MTEADNGDFDVLSLLSQVFGDPNTKANQILAAFNAKVNSEGRQRLEVFVEQGRKNYLAGGGKIVKIEDDPVKGFFEELRIDPNNSMSLVSIRQARARIPGLVRTIKMYPEELIAKGKTPEMVIERDLDHEGVKVFDPKLILTAVLNPDQSTKCFTLALETVCFGNTQQLIAHYSSRGELTSFGIPCYSMREAYEIMVKENEEVAQGGGSEDYTDYVGRLVGEAFEDPDSYIERGLLPYAWLFLDEQKRAYYLDKYEDLGLYDIEDGVGTTDRSRLPLLQGLDIDTQLDRLPLSVRTSTQSVVGLLSEEDGTEAMSFVLPRKMQADRVRGLFETRTKRWVGLSSYLRLNIRIPVICLDHKSYRVAM